MKDRRNVFEKIWHIRQGIGENYEFAHEENTNFSEKHLKIENIIIATKKRQIREKNPRSL